MTTLDKNKQLGRHAPFLFLKEYAPLLMIN